MHEIIEDMETLVDIAYLFILVVVLYGVVKITIMVVKIPYNAIRSSDGIGNIIKQSSISFLVLAALILFVIWLQPVNGIIRGIGSILQLINR